VFNTAQAEGKKPTRIYSLDCGRFRGSFKDMKILTLWPLNTENEGTRNWNWVKGSPTESISSWTAWPGKIGATGFPETSVGNYHPTLRKILKERRYYLHLGGNPESPTISVPPYALGSTTALGPKYDCRLSINMIYSPKVDNVNYMYALRSKTIRVIWRYKHLKCCQPRIIK
jgi:hypothetical protein